MKALKYTLIFISVIGGLNTLSAQMWNGVDTLFGNEWIQYDRPYYKISVPASGFHRLSLSELTQAGFPTGSVQGAELRMYHQGKEIPVEVSTEAVLSNDDYIGFWGEKNRGEIDSYLFADPEGEQLNPQFSMYNDTAAYFLTWGIPGSSPLRYEEQASDFTNLPAKEAWCWAEEWQVFSQSFIEKRYDSQNLVALSNYDEGEGWGSSYQNERNIDFSLEGLWTDEPEASVSVRLFSGRTSTSGSHELEIFFNDQSYYQSEPADYTLLKVDMQAAAQDLEENVSLFIRGNFNNQDRYSVANAYVRYKRDFSAAGSSSFPFSLETATQKRYFEIDDFSAPSGSAYLYDLTNGRKISTVLDDNVVKFTLPAGYPEAEFLLLDSESFLSIGGIVKAVNFEDLRTSDADFIIISHRRLNQSSGGINRVEEYADYRRSMQGGGFSVKFVEVQQLYDQFGYGINYHAIALRNFGNYIAGNWGNAQHILLLGHGFEYNGIRGYSSELMNTHFVPTFGRPGSDHLLFSNNYSSVPALSVGRIAARNPNEIKNYLEKLKLHEQGFLDGQTVEAQAWRKKVLHLVGGNPSEQTLFEFYLGLLKNEIESNAYGGLVNTVTKTNSGPIQTSISEEIINEMNNGVGIKTFFGHGAVVNTDFGLDDPFIFDNKGRYPLIFSLGCLSGNLYDNQNSVSERFVLAPEVGTIAYMASSGFGFTNALQVVADGVYRRLGGSHYGQSIGVVFKEALKEFDNNNSLPIKSLVQQLGYHGDPAVRINNLPQADFITDIASVKINPQTIDAQVDSFELSFSIVNLGFVLADTFAIEIDRKFPNGQSLQIKDTIPTNGTITELTYSIPVGGSAASGINTLEIRLDTDNNVDEAPLPSAESNNVLRNSSGQTGVEFVVIDNSLVPVNPPEFAIVTQTDIDLIASTTDALAPMQAYVFELDTTAYFNSPVKQIFTLNDQGGIIQWKPEVNWQPETVYYWRTAVQNESDPDSLNWRTSSFVYLPDAAPGWNQSHFFQLAENDLENIVIEEPDRKLKYVENVFSIVGEAMAGTSANGDLSRLLINGNRVFRSPFNSQNLSIAVLDPQTAELKKTPGGGNAFSFGLNTPEKRKAIIDFITDSIPSDHYALLFTCHLEGANLFSKEWGLDSLQYGTNLFQILEAEGAMLVRELSKNDTLPYIFGFIKDGPVLGEKLASNEDERVNVIFDIPVFWDSGEMQSVKIGPSQKWETLFWETSTVDAGLSDSIDVRLSGLRADNSSELLYEDIPLNTLDLSNVDPIEFPFIKLSIATADSLNRTSPHLDYWRIYHQGVGDAAVATNAILDFHADTLQQGDPLRLTTAVQNIGLEGLDSLDVRFSISDTRNNQIEILKKLSPLAPGESAPLSLELETNSLEGAHQLIVQLDPEERQVELNRFNNVLVKAFYVRKDEANPLLDITFDGSRIVNGDIVSSAPFILIALRDENPYLKLEDTTSLNISLRYPNGDVRPIYFTDPDVQFFSLDQEKGSEARVEFRPTFAQDGTYTLSVNGRDASDNVADQLDYEVEFEVINDEMISNILPYPNPFSTSCRFAYVLTGNRQPDVFKIQIMTISGKVVKEISKAEFGPMKIGKHLSDFVWDGTDAYGDKLANGVYLYRVITRNFDETIEHYETNADQFFKKGFGKLVILR